MNPFFLQQNLFKFQFKIIQLVKKSQNKIMPNFKIQNNLQCFENQPKWKINEFYPQILLFFQPERICKCFYQLFNNIFIFFFFQTLSYQFFCVTHFISFVIQLKLIEKHFNASRQISQEYQNTLCLTTSFTSRYFVPTDLQRPEGALQKARALKKPKKAFHTLQC
eukprot:TRINITY_DN10270_c0_g1_i6.p2 TRINITY_DN10270_c0_g1~~TRINITY_DN10270_c0_g1_i6.p2  ORF type:complete len:165 (-),score=1.58 TRINITY_DN10270_c0_g1_i6:861-1355(-)